MDVVNEIDIVILGAGPAGLQAKPDLKPSSEPELEFANPVEKDL